jgi:hypothetical protein
MFVPIGSNSGDGYQTQRSLRFRASASAWLSRTFGTATNRKKSTLSMWVKRGALARSVLFSSYLSGTDRAFLEFDSSDRLNFDDFITSQSTLKTSTRVFRDPSAWLHIVVTTDTDQATAEDRVKIWVNNERITSWAVNTNPGLSITPGLNSPRSHYFGQTGAASGYADAYGAEVFFVDGQALTPSAFGEFDSTVTTYWKPKSPAQVRAAVAVGGGARNGFGANGFSLPFSDPTSLTTLMYDRSQSDTDTTGNNWTANNISLTAGATYDSSRDVPLGAGGLETGGYCTWNPLDSLTNKPTQGNLRVGHNEGEASRGTIFQSSGKWYFEFQYDTLTSGSAIGIGTSGASLGSYPGSNSAGYGYSPNVGNKNNAGVSVAYGASFGVSDIVGVAYDLDSGKIWWSKNGVWQASGDPAAGTNAAYTGLSGSFAPMLGIDPGGAGNGGQANFGQRPFAYTPPPGFKALHTGNLTNTTPIASDSFTGNLSTDGPFIWCNGTPETLTINGNAVTWGTHADKLATGFKIRSSSSSYNSSGTNTWTATYLSPSSKSAFKYQNAKGNP